jgi:hypothetical protein
MATKPHRLLDRVSGYADEAAAFLRRRRHLRKPFARVYYHGGRSTAHPSDSPPGEALFAAAGRLIELVPARRARQSKADADSSKDSVDPEPTGEDR